MTSTIFSRTAVPDGDTLGLTREHELVAQPRKGTIDWASFNRSQFDEASLETARTLWSHRAFTEFHSLTHFSQLSSQLHLLGAPLDWSGAFARMVSDEVRHTELCLRMVEALGGSRDLTLPSLDGVHQTVPQGTLRAHVRRTVISAFCIGETLSGRMFKRCLAGANVPLARDVVTAILVDETFHSELGWELGALLMRPDEAVATEVAALEAELPKLFADFAQQCLATKSAAWARAQPEFDDGPNFGTMSTAGYAHAFYEGMEHDVVPGLEAIGLGHARAAWEQFIATRRY
ncbi:MAG: ferritin-like domain-containing protein [Archangium sp.]